MHLIPSIFGGCDARKRLTAKTVAGKVALVAGRSPPIPPQCLPNCHRADQGTQGAQAREQGQTRGPGAPEADYFLSLLHRLAAFCGLPLPPNLTLLS